MRNELKQNGTISWEKKTSQNFYVQLLDFGF